MKGLIYKDLCCLKKHISLFLFTTVGVLIVGVLFIISCKCGNMAAGLEEMRTAEDSLPISNKALFEAIAMFTILIPIAFTGTVVECFKADSAAKFSKLQYSFPFDCWKIVGSRYLSTGLFVGISSCGGAMAAALMASASDEIKLIELLGAVFTFAAIMLMYIDIVIVLLYTWGTQKADLIQILPFIFIGIPLYMAMVFKVMKLPESEITGELMRIGRDILDTIKYKGIYMFAFSLLITFVSYILSVRIAERKKGA